MKRLKGLLIIMLSFFISTIYVNADTMEVDIMEQEYIRFGDVNSYEGCINCGIYLQNKYIYNDFEKFYNNSQYKDIFNQLWEENETQSGYSNSEPLSIFYSLLILSNSSSRLDLYGIVLVRTEKYHHDSPSYDYLVTQTNMYMDGTFYSKIRGVSSEANNPFSVNYDLPNGKLYPNRILKWYESPSPFHTGVGDNINSWYYLPTTAFMTTPIALNNNQDLIINLYDKNNELIKSYPYGETLPHVYEYGEFNAQDNYNIVNLDNYEYVILTLKDYNRDKAFTTNFEVKGQIGITPIYDFGQTAKDTVTGTQIQDRCNSYYNEYTTYPFYILQNDINNNVVYAIKGCMENSSFKYDNTVFDITYITSENKNNPTITINGTTYNTIPYNDLPSTATMNEENNYIPGQSEYSGGSNSFLGLVSGILSNTSSFISSIGAFMSLISKFFYSLPLEIRAVIITSFTTMCTLGVIKFIKA